MDGAFGSTVSSGETQLPLGARPGKERRSSAGSRLVASAGMGRAAASLGELMERYAAGDDSVFDRLYDAMSPPLYRFCLRLTARRHEADDLFQETFLKLHRARATYAPGSNALHWSFAIARSVYLTRLRYSRRRPEATDATSDVAQRDELQSEELSTPEAQLAAEHLLDVLTVELGRMSEKNRSAYILLREEGLSAKDAASLLGTTVDVVKQRAHRAYEHLRAALGDAGWKENRNDANRDPSPTGS